ncbi:MAG: hypothetical protein RLZZ244_2130, partial [Verrucomicrobiota bacterium]
AQERRAKRGRSRRVFMRVAGGGAGLRAEILEGLEFREGPAVFQELFGEGESPGQVLAEA